MGILALLSPIGKLLGDWRAIVTIIIAIILIVCGLKVQHTYKELKNTKATLETTLTINKTLNDEIAKAKKVNDENELIGYCNLLLNDYNLAKKMSDAARQSCDRIFNMQRFIDNWNEVFYSAVGL
jgi:hypothetical protein